MTLYIGLINENEYYSDHYISEVLEKDLKETQKSDELKQKILLLRDLAPQYLLYRREIASAQSPQLLVETQRRWTKTLLFTLGFEQSVRNFFLDEDGELPSLVQKQGIDKSLRIVVFEVVEEGESDDVDPLRLRPLKIQFESKRPPLSELLGLNWEQIIDQYIIPMRSPPRWILLLSVSQLLLVDRYKWSDRRLLRVDFADLFDRIHEPTLRAVGSLFQSNALVGIDGQNLADKLNTNSHRHAHAVSSDLKYALRYSIELLANEAIYDLKNRLHEPVFEQDEQMAAELGRECLRYMYRLLFLFFMEARPELGLVPMKSDVYLQGYSLDHLRALELVQLSTEKARQGYYFHESLSLLFKLVREGYGWRDPEEPDIGLETPVFSQRRIDSHLFSDDEFPILKRVRFRNEVLQKVMRMMSLSPKRHHKSRRGRISYSQLGVNQLGAIYEALLSYKGIFAEHDMYEVQAETSSRDELGVTYLVKSEDIESYSEAERVYELDDHGRKRLRKHAKGSFLFRLAGRDREKTASYYTPETLTRCVVKYALEERISPDMRAKDILSLRVCEPAMGSAAFLNEAVNQLADRYIETRQQELNQRIPAHDFVSEQRRVRQYIVDRNVYGVDLNPVATELGKLSLWLNCMHENGHVPWFGYQVLTGNSLLGARRATFSSDAILCGNWKGVEPTVYTSDSERHQSEQSIYQFLLPHPDMMKFACKKNEIVDACLPKVHEKFAAWHRSFNVKLEKDELEILQLLSFEINELWKVHVHQMKLDRRQTASTLEYWGQEHIDDREIIWSDYREKDAVLRQGVYNRSRISASPWRRLKLVMDYWCAFWFWPIDRVDLLPSREQWISEICLVLTGKLPMNTNVNKDFFRESDLRNQEEELEKLLAKVGALDWEQLKHNYPTIQLVEEIAEQHRFHHWELEYADIFFEDKTGGGFDLVLGNPPWVVPSFNEKGLMSEFDATIAVRKINAPSVRNMVKNRIESMKELQSSWLMEWQTSESTKSFLLSKQNFAALEKQQADLYKSFIVQSWRITNGEGTIGLLHPESVYTDAKGKAFRTHLYTRLRRHFQFHNELRLFEDVHHAKIFSVNIYGQPVDSPRFDQVSNLYSTETIEGCYRHDGSGLVPALRTPDNKWELVPHLRRIVHIDEDALKVFAGCVDTDDTKPVEARLMRVHSLDSLSNLRKLQAHPHRVGNLDDSVVFSSMWHETGDVIKGTIRRETEFVESWNEFVYSGPHFAVSNPFYRTPREECQKNSDYDVLDLTWIPDDYRPRCNFVRACEETTYRARIQETPWSKNTTHNTARELITSKYRSVSRAMVNSNSVRTLQFALVPPEGCCIGSVYTGAFANSMTLLDFVGFGSSLMCDYQVKLSGVEQVHTNVLLNIPIPKPNLSVPELDALRVRTLCLNSLTTAYEALWTEICLSKSSCERKNAFELFQEDSWTIDEDSIPQNFFANLTSNWNRECALRTDRVRRQALVEIDVLVAMLMGFSLKDLVAAYTEQFSVLQSYEKNTWYDKNGRIIHTNNIAAVPHTLPPKAKTGDTRWSVLSPTRTDTQIPLGWEEVGKMKKGTVMLDVVDNTLQTGPENRTIKFEAPFVKCDRVRDYEEAWEKFERRFQ